MDKIAAYTLFSGSTGNCVFVKTPDAAFLVDAGVSARAVEGALRSVGADISQISAVFVTHEHCDHTRGLEVLAKKHHIPTHMTKTSARALIRDPASALLSALCLHDTEYAVAFGNTVVRSFATPHDSADPVGFTVEYRDGEASEKLGIATDIGCIEDNTLLHLFGSDSVIIEANHDVDMLLSGPYPYPLKRRILSETGHLSNENSGKLCRALAENGTRHFLLAHLSKENNYPPTARATVESALAAFDGVTLCVAAPDAPTKLI